MSRQDANAAFALSSFLQGTNATYIDDLYARYEQDPSSVDTDWQDFFKSLKDSPSDVQKNAEGASWGRDNWPVMPRDELTSALDGNWATVPHPAPPLCPPLCLHQCTPVTCCIQCCPAAVPGQQHPHPPLHDCKHTCHVVPLPNMLTLTILAKTWHVLSPMACTHLAMLLPPPALSQWLKSSRAPPSPSTLSHMHSTILLHKKIKMSNTYT